MALRESSDPRLTIAPFANGSEATAWQHRNCDRCARIDGTWDREGNSACQIETAIGVAWGTGEMPSDLAQRAGLPVLDHITDCPERVDE